MFLILSQDQDRTNDEDTYTITICLSVYIRPSSLRKLQCILNDLRFLVSAAFTCRGFVGSVACSGPETSRNYCRLFIQLPGPRLPPYFRNLTFGFR